MLLQGLVDYSTEEQDVEYSVEPQHEDGNGGKASVIGAVDTAAYEERENIGEDDPGESSEYRAGKLFFEGLSFGGDEGIYEHEA